MKVAVCAIAKQENQYIREWVEHYKFINVDHIFLYDNNDPDGETFDEVLSDYIANGFVTIIDYRGRKVCQFDAYNECYLQAGYEYDWIMFFDCDEFLTLTKKKDIHHELQLARYKGYQAIHVNWKSYGDGGLVYNDGRPVKERIKEPIMPLDFKKRYTDPENNHVKCIVRTNISGIHFGGHLYSHSMEGLSRVCDTNGKPIQNNVLKPYIFDNMYLKHYSTKTTQEYIEKVKRGFPDSLVSGKDYNELMVAMYFLMNEETQEKIDLFNKELGTTYGAKRRDVQIFMLCYDPKPYGFIDNSIITPLQCGAAVSGYDVCPLKDNLGDDNVSAMNRYYVENSGTYWMWRNVRDAKYIGQMQYGRRLKIDENTDFEGIFKDYDVIVAKPYHFEKPKEGEKVIAGATGWIPADNIADGYAFSHCGRDLDLMELIVKKIFPDYSDDWDKYIKNGKDLLYSAGFVMPYDLFNQYCVFLFSCLKSWLLSTGCNRPEDLYIHVMRNLYTGGYIRPEFKDPNKVPNGAIDWQTSLGGFFGERLLTLFVYHNCKNIYYTDYEKTDPRKPL